MFIILIVLLLHACVGFQIHSQVLRYSALPGAEPNLLPRVWAALSDLLPTSRIKRGDDSLGVRSGNTAVLSCLLPWLTHSVRGNRPPWRDFPQM